MSVEPIAKSTGCLEADGENIPQQFEYVEPKKSGGKYITSLVSLHHAYVLML